MAAENDTPRVTIAVNICHVQIIFSNIDKSSCPDYNEFVNNSQSGILFFFVLIVIYRRYGIIDEWQLMKSRKPAAETVLKASNIYIYIYIYNAINHSLPLIHYVPRDYQRALFVIETSSWMMAHRTGMTTGPLIVLGIAENQTDTISTSILIHWIIKYCSPCKWEVNPFIQWLGSSRP